MSEQPAHGSFCWNERMTTDMEAAREFYASLFGWTYGKSMSDEPYSIIENRGREQGGIMTMPPGSRQDAAQLGRLFSPIQRITSLDTQRMAELRQAMSETRKIRLCHTRLDGESSERTLWPLGLFFWGRAWTLGARCELRSALRNFRLDRIDRLQLLEDRYPDIPGRRLVDLIEQGRERCHDACD